MSFSDSWESDREGETVTHQLKLDANEKNEVVATYYGMLDGLKSTKGKIEGDKLVLDFDVERDGFAFQAKYDATIKEDNASGTLSLSSDQGSQDLPWEAKRTVELSDVVGTWELKLESPDGEVHEPIMTIQNTDDTYTASWDGKGLGEFPVKDLKAKDGKFTFTVTGEIEGSDFIGKCTTSPRGSKFKGEMLLEIGGDSIDMPISGKLAKSTKKP